MHYCFQIATFLGSSSQNLAGIFCLPHLSYMQPIIALLISLCQQRCMSCLNYEGLSRPEVFTPLV